MINKIYVKQFNRSYDPKYKKETMFSELVNTQSFQYYEGSFK